MIARSKVLIFILVSYSKIISGDHQSENIFPLNKGTRYRGENAKNPFYAASDDRFYSSESDENLRSTRKNEDTTNIQLINYVEGSDGTDHLENSSLTHFSKSEGKRKKAKKISDSSNLAVISDRKLLLKNSFPNLENNSIVERNGRRYWLRKVKKTTRNHENNNDSWQEKALKIMPRFLSFWPLPWVKKEKVAEQVNDVSETSNSMTWSKVIPIEKNNSFGEPTKTPNGKLKKLLNLFTVVRFENTECQVNGVTGICLHQSECESKGGKFMATCAKEQGVCCYNEKSCGDHTSENSTYFANEGFPSTSSVTGVCTLTLVKSTPNVEQLHLEFLDFKLRDPSNGTCLHDRLVIIGQDRNNIIPDICGINSGQHIYVQVGDSAGPFKLNVITVGEYFQRTFLIKITQLEKDLSPKHCLQYYTEPAGNVQIFNYRTSIPENVIDVGYGYFNNLNYAICIKKLKGFCSITYENEEANTKQPSFQLFNVNEEGESLIPPLQAGAETFDCPDDYIVINGLRLCGEKLNDISIEIDFTKNYPVTDNSNGPFILHVRTNGAINGRGFHLKYRQNLCSI